MFAALSGKVQVMCFETVQSRIKLGLVISTREINANVGYDPGKWEQSVCIRLNIFIILANMKS